jgi:hypothetical protein
MLMPEVAPAKVYKGCIYVLELREGRRRCDDLDAYGSLPFFKYVELRSFSFQIHACMRVALNLQTHRGSEVPIFPREIAFYHLLRSTTLKGP